MQEQNEFKGLIDAIKEIRAKMAPFVKQNNAKIKKVIDEKITDNDFLDKLLDESLELCYSSDDHSGYLSLVEYIRTFDPVFADEHYKFYHEWFIETEIEEN